MTRRRPPHDRGIFCNRTLNLRAIRAIGYDMDYTLVHYKVDEWERRAYAYVKGKFSDLGWPVDDLEFDPDLMVRGLIIDTESGNVLKANRFGYVKRAFHGTHQLDFDEQRRTYARIIVDLNEPRYVFLNTLFSLSEACLYAQLVDRLDRREIPEVLGYADLYSLVRRLIDEAHVEGLLKADIVGDPDRFIELDPEVPLALLDQQRAGKRLLLITNSEWEYTQAILAYAFDRFLPGGMTWRELFDVAIVSARKPEFFSSRSPVFEVVDASGLLKPARALESGRVFVGGNAALVEEHLGVSGDQILYVGDHLFADVHVSKSVLRWRTALILRELEADLAADSTFATDRERLQAMMRRKEALEFEVCQLRLELQRARDDYGPRPPEKASRLESELATVRDQLDALDHEIGPLAAAAAEVSNPRWGPLMRTGNDKSHLARQVERYADIYLSRVSNFLYQTPFVYLRSPRGTLPHDTDATPLGDPAASDDE
ncbi:MAG TPA: HAD-IG family 5'-nucleotidase [Gemmatimonadales bacterium]|nr:HAD-IG family 5'-nucleotidase [Gemmatimonadales bacterium]